MYGDEEGSHEGPRKRRAAAADQMQKQIMRSARVQKCEVQKVATIPPQAGTIPSKKKKKEEKEKKKEKGAREERVPALRVPTCRCMYRPQYMHMYRHM